MKLVSAAVLTAILSAGAAIADPVTLRLGHAVFEEHPFHDSAVRFKEAAERISNGDVKVDIYPARQLGDVKELSEGVQFGTIDMTVNSAAAYDSLVPQLDAFQLPHLIPDYETFAKVALLPETRAIMDGLEAHGMVALALNDGGLRHFMTIKPTPVQSMEDFKGLKTRVAPQKLYLDTWKAAGVNPTPMAYGEVYSALETGTLDAVEINLTSIESEKYYEVGKSVTLTSHYFWPSLIIINKARLDGLSESQQAAIRQAAEEITEPQILAIKALDEQIAVKLEGMGIPVLTPSVEFMADFDKAEAPVIAEYAKDPMVADFVDAVQKLKAGN